MTRLVRIDELPDSARRGVISIGNFDGVHLGHAALLGEVSRLAKRLHGPSVAVILDPHPVSLLRPQAAPERLTTIARRVERLNELGIEFLVVCPIDRDFLRMSAEEFFHSLVVDQLQASGIVEGPNFYFGRDRGGDIEYLKELCRLRKMELSIAGPVHLDGEMVSSTRIRTQLRRGEVTVANRLLGARYRLEGRVEMGEQRGRTLGFPTANLTDIATMVPGHGVYGGNAIAGDRCYQAAIHIGPNPTFGNSEIRKVEVHLLDYIGDLYQQSLLVDFATRVRDIARFDSPEQLADQLALDVQMIRDQLATIDP